MTDDRADGHRAGGRDDAIYERIVSWLDAPSPARFTKEHGPRDWVSGPAQILLHDGSDSGSLNPRI